MDFIDKKNCIKCKKQNVKPIKTSPTPLPIQRVLDACIFEVTGVDFAGPIFLKGRQKGWICLYTCAVYRAVHLELVTSLSTNEFLGTFRRFIARRGRPSIMYSDNGTNFIGADNAFSELNWNIISEYSAAERIDWRFNPPTAAWWGGWWERLIGVIKGILRRVLGKACLTYEEMVTVLCDCEITINSRPLTYVSEDINDLKPLTPFLFLREIRDNEIPDLDFINSVDLNARLRYKQRIMEQLRTRFRKEYLSQLIMKSDKPEPRTLREGDIVLIGDDSKKRFDWPMARIEKLIMGRDNTPRVALLKAKNDVLKRPIQRIYPLEINAENNNDLFDDGKDFREKMSEREFLSEIKNSSVSKTRNVDGGTVKNCQNDEVIQSDKKTRSGRIVMKPDRLMYKCNK